MRVLRRKAIGVVVYDHIIRAVSFEKVQKKPICRGEFEYPLPDGAVKDGIILDVYKVSEGIKGMWSKYKLGKDHIILGISNSGVIARFAYFPDLPEDKLAGFVKYQAQEYIPMPVEDVVLDYIIVDRKKGEQGEQLEALMVAASKKMVNDFIVAFSESGLDISDIDYLPIALLRMLPLEAQNSGVAMVHLFDGNGAILIIQNGIPRLARHFSVNAHSNIEPDKGMHKEISEVVSSIKYYQTHSQSVDIQKVFLCGQPRCVNDTIAPLENALSIPVVPLKSAYNTAVETSLALRGIGL